MLELPKRRRRKRRKFRKFYRFNKQDEYLLSKIHLLHLAHSMLAKEIYSPKQEIFGDWSLKTCGITLFVDPILGSQAEIEGTSKLPVEVRLKLHIRLLQLIHNGYSIFKAVKLCHLILKTQSIN